MSRWLGRIWGGMRLCGNTASLAQVATKQREVFRRLCNMYMVTPATACPQGINGGLAVADGRRDRGVRVCVPGVPAARRAEGGSATWAAVLAAMHGTRQRGGGKKAPSSNRTFLSPHHAHKTCQKQCPGTDSPKVISPRKVPLTSKRKLRNLSQAQRWKQAGHTSYAKAERLTVGTARPGTAAGEWPGTVIYDFRGLWKAVTILQMLCLFLIKSHSISWWKQPAQGTASCWWESSCAGKNLFFSTGEGAWGCQTSMLLQQWGAEGIRTSAVALTELRDGLGL